MVILVEDFEPHGQHRVGVFPAARELLDGGEPQLLEVGGEIGLDLFLDD